MCGIVGYIGTKDAYPVLVGGLKRLEYRGYDSAGVALLTDSGDLQVYKTHGKVADLENFVSDKDISGKVGIAHTRWATHGEPNDVNAHPHFSQSHNLALIHNGIIENYATIKDDLISKGYKFVSDTDTEVLVQLIEYVMDTHHIDTFAAVQLALTQVVGAYAIAVLNKKTPDRIIAARKSSPMAIGVGDDGFYIGSDATALIEHTKNVIYMDDEEVVRLQLNHKPEFFSLNNVRKTHEITKLEMSLSELEKGGYPHFMLKEIFEQPKVLKASMKGRINLEQNNVAMSGVIDFKDKFINAERIIIVACGTSWHAGLVGEFLMEEIARIPVEVEYASEFRYRNPIINKNDIVIAISQSGETADTLAAVELAKSKGAFVYGICNVVGSAIARATDTGSYTHVGPEIGVASTKAFTAQVTTLSLIALSIAREKKNLSKEIFEAKVKELASIPSKMGEVLKMSDYIKDLSKLFTYARNFLYLGRGYNYPVALEGALKLKEISYIHAEGYPAAEMKHGPIALIDQDMPTVVLATNRGLYEKVISNIREIKARRGRVLAVVTKRDKVIRKIVDYVIEIPDTCECFVPLLSVIPLQLLAYYVAVEKGCDVDQPRNLAKSVTVE